MKKIYYKLANLYYTIKFKIQKKFYKVSPRGEYMIKYLIDRYINCTLLETNEVYESTLRLYIQNHIDKIPDTLLKNTSEMLREDIKKYHCVFAYLCSLLLFTENKREWLDYIIDERWRKLIIKIIGD